MTITSSDDPAAQNKRASARITYYDWLRGMATIAVVALHMFNMMLTAHSVDELGVPMVIAWSELQLVFTRWAVAIFLMITGALLLDPKRSIGWEKVARYIARMIAALAIICPTYACVSAHGMSLQAIGEGLINALTNNSWDHLWYVYALIGLYAFTPVLSVYTHHATRIQQRTTLLVLAFFTLVVPTISKVIHTDIYNVVWVTYPLFYYLLGTYAQRYLTLTRTTMALGLGSLGLCALIVVLLILLTNTYPNWVLIPKFPLIAPWALLVFLLAKTYLNGRAVPKPLALMSHLSLAVYLVHPIVLVVLYRRLWWMPYETFPPVVFELVVFSIALGASVGIAAALKRIPKLGDIL